MEFKPSEKKPIRVSVGDKVYEIKRPQIGVIKQFQSDLRQEDANKALDLIVTFCEKLGLPKEVVESWDIYTLNEFIEFLTNKKKD